MGQSITTVRSSIKIADEEARTKAKQDLDVLNQACSSILNEFEAKLDDKFLNPDASQKTDVPGIRALRKTRFHNLIVKDAPNKSIADAVDDFFKIGTGEFNTEDAVMKGFKKVVTSALGPFIERTDVGQHKEERYFIYVMHNAVVRLDVMLWRWNFAGKSFSDKYESALGYLVCTSVVDVAALKTSEFLFLISEYVGDEEEEVIKYTQKMQQIYDTARRTKLDQASKSSGGQAWRSSVPSKGNIEPLDIGMNFRRADS